MATPPDNSALQIRCPAKLNLTLAVGSPRDDGLHPIGSVMVALDFGDDLELSKLRSGPSRFERHFAEDAPRAQAIDWPIERDLIYRAHAALEAHVGRSLPMSCVVQKRIPAGAGLGGGSSNAAAVLVGLRALFELEVPDEALLAIAQGLGADVVFLVRALLGQPAALVTGIGEVMLPMTNLPAFEVVLIFPDGACPTAAVYRAYDAFLNGENVILPTSLSASWAESDTLPAPHNDLTGAAIRVCPQIAQVIDAFHAVGFHVRLTGSGSAMFVVVDASRDPGRIVETAKRAGLATCLAAFDPKPASGFLAMIKR